MSSSFAEKTRYAMRTGLLENKSKHIDSRPMLIKAADYLPVAIGFMIFLGGFVVLLFPAFSYLLILVGVPIFFYGFKVQMDFLVSAPMPKDTRRRKKREARKRKQKAARSRGFLKKQSKNKKRPPTSEELRSGFRLKFGDALMLVGYDLLFGRQIWIDLDRETRMSLISGTTGAGKTVTLCAQLFQACIQGHLPGGAPVFLVDGKGSIEGLYDFLFYIVRTGRLHDLRILNFLTGGETQNLEAMLDEHFTSNRFNPFSMLNHDECRGLVMSFGKSGDDGGSNAYFRDRASNMLSGAFPVLTYKRDHQGAYLDITVLQQSLGLRDLIRLAADSSIPLSTRKPLQDYLKTLNAIDDSHFDERGHELEINSKADEQHTYNKSMVTKTVNEMAGTLGHIFSSVGSDLNTRNVILHGQIGIVLLPAIEKDPDSMAELGRMLVGSLRPAFATAFGFKVQGLKSFTVDGLPTQRIVPVRVFLDEVIQYYTKGISSFLSLLRSLKICFTLLGQSMKGLEDAGVSEGRQTAANLNNKYMFSSQDIYETFEMLSKNVGKMVVTRLSEMTNGLWGGWKHSGRLSYAEEDILNERDQASADSMEGMYIYRGNPVPMKSATFFPDDDRDGTLDEFYLNQFAELESPTESQIARTRSILGFSEKAATGDIETIDPGAHASAVLDYFLGSLSTVHSHVQKVDATGLYSFQNVLSYALINDAVEADLARAKEEEAELAKQGEAEREAILASRDAETVLLTSDESTQVVDTASYFSSLSDEQADVIGVTSANVKFAAILDDDDEESEDTGSTDENEPSDNSSSASEQAASSEHSSSTNAANTAETSSTSSAGNPFVSKDSAMAKHQNRFSFGRVHTETPEQQIAEHSQSPETANESERSGNGAYRSSGLQAVADDLSESTGLDSEQIMNEIFDAEVYPTYPTPDELSDDQQQAVVSDVHSEFDDAIARIKAEHDQVEQDLLSELL